jgi:hypothetical protein
MRGRWENEPNDSMQARGVQMSVRQQIKEYENLLRKPEIPDPSAVVETPVLQCAMPEHQPSPVIYGESIFFRMYPYLRLLKKWEDRAASRGF